MKSVDLLIVSGGIVGSATAYRFVSRYPQESVIIPEKESEMAQHQSWHNSGVIP